MISYMAACRKAGLNLSSAIVITALSGHAEVLTMGKLAELCGITTAAITGTIDRLETAGVVKRIHATEDRRMVGVTLTQEGRHMAGKLNRRIAA